MKLASVKFESNEKACKGQINIKEAYIMPRGDGTGPTGKGPGTGRGRGMGRGKGIGRMGGNRPGAGPSGVCVCPNCKTEVPHKVGIPCYSMECPKCGTKMVRK